MSGSRTVGRLLGAAFLFVFVASIVSSLLLDSVTGSGSVLEMLASIADNLGTMQISILIGLFTSVGIVVLASLLYAVLYKQQKIVALVALGWWLAEAVLLAISKIGALGLVSLSQDFVAAGAPEASFHQMLGRFLYSDLLKQGDDIHMLFYCLGGILWFYLFFRSRCIPRVLSILGIVIESVGLVGMILLLLSVQVDMLVFYPIAALELIVGVWLLIRGTPAQEIHQIDG